MQKGSLPMQRHSSVHVERKRPNSSTKSPFTNTKNISLLPLSTTRVPVFPQEDCSSASPAKVRRTNSGQKKLPVLPEIQTTVYSPEDYVNQNLSGHPKLQPPATKLHRL